MKKIVKLFAVMLVALIPAIANALEITSSSTPVYDAEKNLLAANGTAIVIEEREGTTYVTWDGNDTGIAVNDQTIVAGGYFNPYVDSKTTIDLDSTSVTMNSGKVNIIVGGNVVVNGGYTNYDKIYVKEVNVDINGGTVNEVAGISLAYSSTLDTVLTSDYYGTDFYSVDKLNIDIDNATVSDRIYALSSYTSIKDVVINISNSTVENNSALTGSLGVGTNGVVDSFVANIDNSNIATIHGGLRAMVGSMKINAKGNTTIGDIYAGSYYAKSETYDGTNGWSGWRFGDIDYGQVGSLEFNLEDGVNYNNIYAGFQFVDKEKFQEKFSGEAALETYAKGIEGSEKAKVVINIASAPKVTDSGLVSMIDASKENVEINYMSKVEDLPVIDPSEDVTEPIIGITNVDKINEVLQNTLKTNEIALDYVANGVTVSTTIEMNAIEPEEEVANKINQLLADEKVDGKILGYFDISILLKNDAGDTLTTIPELSDAIELSIKLPSNLEPVKEGLVRKYYVIREHKGKVELIDAKLSEDGSYLTFNSDKFSTYALTYVDVEDMSGVTSPDTGDNVVLYMALGLISLVGFGFLVKNKKRA